MSIICGIYAIKNICANQVYIGQSINIYEIWKSHKNDLLRKKLQNSYNKKEIANIFEVSRTVITRICNGTRWFHITGGKIIKSERRGLRNIVKPRSESFKIKIRKKLSGRNLSQETKNKISKSKLGKKRITRLKGD